MLNHAYSIYSNNIYLQEMAERILINNFNQDIFRIEFAGPIIELYGRNKGKETNSYIFVRLDSQEKLERLVESNCRIINLSDCKHIKEPNIEKQFNFNISGVRNHRLCTYALSLALRLIKNGTDINNSVNLFLLKNAGDR